MVKNKIHSIKGLFKSVPEGSGALFFIQIFATFSFAVLYSSLVLFMKQGLGFKTHMANMVMGSFIAFNYGLHLMGGYLGGRFLSYRNLFMTGMVLQVIACLSISLTDALALYWGLALFLAGAGLNVTCINMMLTQRFKPDDKRREAAFLWNYSGMNLGFLLGFTMAGYFQLSLNFQSLFIFSSFSGVATIILTVINWHRIRDQNTSLVHQLQKGGSVHTKNFMMGMAIIAALIPTLFWLLNHAAFSNKFVIFSGIMMAIFIFVLALQQPTRLFRLRILAFLILCSVSLVFWAMYQLAPMGLTVFALYNVDRNVFGFMIPPQWIQNINTVIIIIGGPLLVVFLKRIRARIRFSIPLQFSVAMLMIGIGFILLPVGIHYASAAGYVNFRWIAWSYFFQSIGELLLSPIGYAMIGLLAPPKQQGILMGTWMLTQGIGGVFSSLFSNYAISEFHSTNPVVTNPGYSHTFFLLGVSAVGCSVLLVLLVPMLRRLINERHSLHRLS